MSSPGAERRVLANAEEVARAAADLVGAAARRAIQSRRRLALALSGGNTPRRAYQLLAQQVIDWARVHVFWGDERCVPPDNESSNFHMAAEALIDNVELPPANLHRIRGEAGAHRAAELYRQELATFFGSERPAVANTAAEGPGTSFDLVLLGLGDDGHTASLFPGDPSLDSLDWATASHAPPGLPVPERVTVTLATIAQAREVVFLVTGEGKADVVRRVFAGDASLPATRVRARERVLWLLDRAAAGETAARE